MFVSKMPTFLFLFLQEAQRLGRILRAKKGEWLHTHWRFSLRICPWNGALVHSQLYVENQLMSDFCLFFRYGRWRIQRLFLHPRLNGKFHPCITATHFDFKGSALTKKQVQHSIVHYRNLYNCEKKNWTIRWHKGLEGYLRSSPWVDHSSPVVD